MTTPRICIAIRKARKAAPGSPSQDAIAKAIGRKQASVSAWERDTEPGLDDLAAVEKFLGLPRGYLLRSAGYVKDATTVEAMIEADPKIHPNLRGLVVDAYESAVRRSADLFDDGTPASTSAATPRRAKS